VPRIIRRAFGSAAEPLRGYPAFSGITTTIGGTALRAGQCIAGTARVPEARIGMAVIATPSAYPGDGFAWRSYVSEQGIITVKVCAESPESPATSIYNVRVLR
jgi:hypothetical protein